MEVSNFSIHINTYLHTPRFGTGKSYNNRLPLNNCVNIMCELHAGVSDWTSILLRHMRAIQPLEGDPVPPSFNKLAALRQLVYRGGRNRPITPADRVISSLLIL